VNHGEGQVAMLDLTGTLDGLKRLELSDLRQYKNIVNNGSQKSFAFYFPGLLTQHRPGRKEILLEETENTLCVYRLKSADNTPKLDLLLAPIPMNLTILRRCIERANDFNGNKRASILTLDAEDIHLISGNSKFRIKKRNTEYLYAPSDFEMLSSAKFKLLRDEVVKVLSLDNVHILPYTPQHKEACLALLRKWQSLYRDIYNMSTGIGNARRLLDLASTLTTPDLHGEVIYLDDKLVAYSFGGEIRPNLGVLLEAKNDLSIPGLSYFQHYSFFKKMEAFELVNGGPYRWLDNPSEMKERLCPVGIHIEYRANQREERKSILTGTNASDDSFDLSGALSGLKILDTEDLVRYQTAIGESMQEGWAYYFPYLLTRNQPGDSLILFLEDEGSICVFLWSQKRNKARLDLLLAPTPMSTNTLKRCIERANEFNKDYSARVMRVDSRDTPHVKKCGIQLKVRKQQYIYAPENYTHLTGKKFYTLRRNVSLVERSQEVEVHPYSLTHADACGELLRSWGQKHRETHGSYGGIRTSRRALELAGKLPLSVLRGEVIYIEGKLVAYALGGEIRPGLACSFERKCDTGIRGLGYYQLRSFLSGFKEFTLVNDGSDAGNPGLKQLKDSFRPVDMHLEYRGTQKR
jgi:hypothetical protein